MQSERRPLSLVELQRLVGNSIRINPHLQSVWVVAELSDVRVAGGHCYMELVEKDEHGSFRAKLRAMIWNSTLGPLQRRFAAETGRQFGSGMKVLVRGTVTHHEIYGISFVINDIDASYTLGDMERLRREILERLGREGVMDENRKLPMPAVPQRIAVISASGAAGYGDFINQLVNNEAGYCIYPFLFGAVMQGERTVPTVLNALDKVEATSQFWDCVVIIRGGGATAELNSFDNYELAKRVAIFPLPVVVGIGHERDRTVLDELACVRCKTPTAVAAYILDRIQAYYDRVADCCRYIGNYASHSLQGEKMRLSQAELGLPARVAARTMNARMRLERLGARISSAVGARMMREKGRLDMCVNSIEKGVVTAGKLAEARLERLEGMLRVLSPQNTLNRGYSITRVNGHAVSDPSMLRSGEVIETTLAHGKIYSTVKVTEKEYGGR